MREELVGYFGFGSLVNRHTLRTDFIGTRPARLKGWRRHWQARSNLVDPDMALLSIHQDPGCAILGLLVIDKMQNLALLDAREAGYVRQEISADQIEFLGPLDSSQENLEPPALNYVYVAGEPAGNGHGGPLLQSYCDAVMQGFRNEFGEEGVTHFIDTTSGFERKIILDRAKPLYPRAVRLDEAEMGLFDATLRAAGVQGI